MALQVCLNSVTDTLPHNANLFKWKKLSSSKCQLCGEHQSLAHVLNACQKALSLRRYSARHDDVLQVITDFASRLLPEGMHITADLPGMHYSFPQDITTTDLRPDIIIWDSQVIYLVELTVPFETNIDDAVARKVHRYQDLRDACALSRSSSIITLEVGSRGFLYLKGFQSCIDCCGPNRETFKTSNLM